MRRRRAHRRRPAAATGRPAASPRAPLVRPPLALLALLALVSLVAAIAARDRLVAVATPLNPALDRALGAGPDELAYSLLNDNRLLAVRLRDGTVVADHPLAPPPARRLAGHGYTAHALAVSRDGSRLFALVTSRRGDQNDRIVVVDAASAAIRAAHDLAERGVYQSLVVGPTSGRLYVFGFRLPSTAMITALDPDDGRVAQTWTAQRATDLIYQGGVSTDERRLFISYHNSGVDWYDLTGAGLRHCRNEPMALGGCVRAHGGFAPRGDGLLIATGEPVALDVDREGAVRRGFDTGLAGRHLADFAVDDQTGRLYAVGACDDGGGFSAVDLAGGGALPAGHPINARAWSWISPPKPPVALLREAPSGGAGTVPCGERLALGPSGSLVVGRPSGDGRAGPAALLVIDERTGRVVHAVPTAADPIDVRVTAAA